jgi:predicted nucleic acid-binding protein
MNGLKRYLVHIEEPASLWGLADELGAQHGIQAQTYDLLYFALAQHLGVEWWTGDGRFYRSLKPAPAWVRLMPSTRFSQ